MAYKKNKMTKRININNLCSSNGLLLKESPLKERLLGVILDRKVVVLKKSLDRKTKQFLVSAAIAHVRNNPTCQLAIFLKDYKEFFVLKSAP